MGKIKIVRVKLHRWGVNDYSHVSLYKKYGYKNHIKIGKPNVEKLSKHSSTYPLLNR